MTITTEAPCALCGYELATIPFTHQRNDKAIDR